MCKRVWSFVVIISDVLRRSWARKVVGRSVGTSTREDLRLFITYELCGWWWDKWVDLWMHDLVSGWMDRCMNKWIDRWTDGLMVGWKDMSGWKDISGQMDEILSLEVNKWMDGRMK